MESLLIGRQVMIREELRVHKTEDGLTGLGDRRYKSFRYFQMSYGFTWGKAYTIEACQLVGLGMGSTIYRCLLVVIDDHGQPTVLYDDGVVVLPEDFTKVDKK